MIRLQLNQRTNKTKKSTPKKNISKTGFGFNGLDAKGNQKWDLVLNLDYLAVEVPWNFRSAMTGLNL